MSSSLLLTQPIRPEISGRQCLAAKRRLLPDVIPACEVDRRGGHRATGLCRGVVGLAPARQSTSRH